MSLDARVYYPNENSPGIVCQIYAGYVFEAGEPNARPLKDYGYGRFVKLVEMPDPTPLANMPPEGTGTP